MSEKLISKFLDLNIPVVLFPTNTKDNNIENDSDNLKSNLKECGPDSTLTPFERYIITYKNEVDANEKTKNMDKIPGFQSQHIFDKSMNGCAATMNKGLLQQIMNDPEVTYIEKDNLHYSSSIYDKQPLPEISAEQVSYWHQTITNTVKTSTDDFSNIHCYVLDTGILPNHAEFNTGQVVLNYNSIDKTKNAIDNNGHGTAVASVIGGINVGCANKVILHSIKVLDASGAGYTSDIISGINWVLSNKGNNPCVINMSLGGAYSSTLNAAVQNCINLGVQIVCAAGNEGVDAGTSSPANAVGALTISAYDDTKTRPSWANYGSVLRSFAPGVSIRAGWGDSSSSYYLVSGTSFACPIVAAIVCRILKQNPTITPTQIREAISRMNLTGEIINPGSSTTPNVRVVWDSKRVSPC